MTFQSHLDELKKTVDASIEAYLCQLQKRTAGLGTSALHKAMSYSLSSGGQRLRPILSLLVAEALNKPLEDVLGLGCAVELIHTYSLIHDDLPCMDDDDFRRGKPSSHKEFGEAMAVLAGDAISTEAFRVLSQRYADRPQLALELVSDLAEAAGPEGMVGGQVLDFKFQDRVRDLSQKERMNLHQRKTGELFRVSAVGAAKVSGANADELQAVETYARWLGQIFQLVDDLMDGEGPQPEEGRRICQEWAEQARQAVGVLGERGDRLNEFVRYICARGQA